MRDLSTPLRVTWELPADAALAARLAARLAEGRVLFVEVHVGPEALGGLAGLGEARGRARLTLAGGAETLAAALAVLGSSLAPSTELLVLPPYSPAVSDLVASGHRVVPALWSTPAGVAQLGDALKLAVTHGCAAVAILNPPAPAEALGPGDRAAAAATWQGSSDPRPALRVHDLFLAEALGLDPWRDYRGCQAGQGLAHLTASGEVLACRTLPLSLGDLDAEPLEALWAGASRQRLRVTLAGAPAACGACTLGPTCGGGCRGLAPHLGVDPSCPGPRP